ncbi:AzlC family ABC transporter permease [Propionibacteriaceae bacterium G1746]|uniref:AzlC family ABC transporter permease n=1 Tax=Aestuariimicrobium sp. G57 TaxID=3418485 RepID=UPI003C17751C
MSSLARTALSVSVATSLYGISFGALAVAAGLSVVQTQLLSLLMFTGGSQFAFVAAISGGGGGWAAVSAASLMGLRNAVYGAQMNAELRPKGFRRLLAAHVTIDESVAVAMAQPAGQERAKGFAMTGWGVFIGWNVMTLAGSLLTSRVDPSVWGLDGAAVAAFVGLLWPRLKNREAWSIAAVAALAAVVTTPVAPLGTPILVAALVAGLLGWRWAR